MSAANSLLGVASETSTKTEVEARSATAPTARPGGRSGFPCRAETSRTKFNTTLMVMEATQASPVARFQFMPMQTLGTMAAAKVPHPNVPSSAIRFSI